MLQTLLCEWTKKAFPLACDCDPFKVIVLPALITFQFHFFTPYLAVVVAGKMDEKFLYRLKYELAVLF